MTFELVSEAITRGQLRLLATLGDSSLHQNLVLILETCLPHCPYSLCLCRLGSSDCSRRRGIAAPSLHSQGHCLGGAGASPFALHQCHQRGPNPRHSCLQDQKTSFLCGEPKNHGKQIALLIIEQGRRQNSLWRSLWLTGIHKMLDSFWKASRHILESRSGGSSTSPHLIQLLNCSHFEWTEGLGPCCCWGNSFSLGSASMGRSLYLSPLEIQGGNSSAWPGLTLLLIEEVVSWRHAPSCQKSSPCY